MTTIYVSIPGREYPIHVGASAVTELVRILRTCSGVNSTGRAQSVVITDYTVRNIHGHRLLGTIGGDTPLIAVPAGEASKSLATAETVYDALAKARLDRAGVIIAFGGGVVGDLAGFVAATWMRGVRFIQVPTTLEAAIDASVGGKTAVNLKSGKNLVGAFHQPAAVIVETDFLATLPQRDYVAGLAESVKHAVVRDPAFFVWHEQNAAAILARDPAVLEQLIAWNCRIKADVVAADERERDLRAILNYGHTIGHALEHLFEYELRHGECVALGILVENEIAVRRGMLDAAVARRIAALLAASGLPRGLPRAVPMSAVLDACRLDKKNTGGTITFVLAKDVGSPARCSDVSDAEFLSACALVQPAAGE